MASDINSINITGNLTREPELRATVSSNQVLNFGIASNEARRNQQTGQWDEYPNFVDVTMFGARAEALSRLLRKGMKIAVNGSLRYSSWERDGQKRSKLEIIAHDIVLMSRNGRQTEQDGGYGPQSSYQAPSTQPDVYDRDLPF